ncbi:MAG: thiamine pyrophosphate-dependent enzyme, partial [Bacteroidota bacterium]
MAKEIKSQVEIDKSNGSTPTGKIDSFGGMTKDELMNVLRLMNLSRTMDIKVMNLLKQGKAFFHIAGAGHEATQIAFGLAMNKGIDWAFPYYRDMCFMLTLGMKPEDAFLAFL